MPKRVGIVSRLQFLALATALVGCGAGALSSSSWKENPVALSSRAEAAYNAGKYDEAVDLYKQVLVKDPANSQARIGMAYSYNAKANLSILSLVAGAAQLSTLSGTGNSSNRLSGFLEVVGTKGAERDKLRESLQPATGAFMHAATVPLRNVSLERLMKDSSKLTQLMSSFQAICPLLKRKSIEDYLKSNPAADETFKIREKCFVATDAGTEPSSSVVLAVALSLLGQGATLFQVALDQDNDGELDAVAQMASVVNSLASASKGGTTLNLAVSQGSGSELSEIVGRLSKLNESLITLINVAQDITSPVLAQVFANFTLSAVLISDAKGVPGDVASNIKQATARFNDSYTRVRRFTKEMKSRTNGLTPEKRQIAAALKTSSTAVQNLIGRYDKAATLASRGTFSSDDSAKAELKNFCSTFGKVKDVYGLPDAINSPSQCATLGAAL